MKKIFLLFLITLTSNYNFAGIEITKYGAGPNGYNTIKEKHDGNDHTLLCKDPGYASCIWENQPTIIGHSGTIYFADFLAGLAENYIALGQQNGTIIHNGEILITWIPFLGGNKITIENL